MKAFLVGFLLILGAVAAFFGFLEFLFYLGSIILPHLSKEVKAFMFVVILISTALSALVGHSLGENFLEWRNRK